MVLAVVRPVCPREGLAGARTGATLAAVTVSVAVSVAVLKAVVPPLAVAAAVVPALAGGLVPSAVGNGGRFGVGAVGRVLEGGAGGQQEGLIGGDRADGGEGRLAAELIGPGALARGARQGDAAQLGIRVGVGDGRGPGAVVDERGEADASWRC